MEQFIRIRRSVFNELGLSGNEAILYAYISEWCDFGGGKIYSNIKSLSEQFNIPYMTARRIIDNLVGAGLITKERGVNGVVLSIPGTPKTCQPSVQNEHSEVFKMNIPSVQNEHSPSVQIEHSSVQIEHSSVQNEQSPPHPPYILDIKKIITENTHTTGAGEQACVREEGGGDGEMGTEEMRGVLMEGMQQFFQKKGMTFFPNYALLTTSASDIVSKVRQAAAGKDIASWWSAFLGKAWDTADNFQRERFDFPLLNTQFNQIYNRIYNPTKIADGKQQSGPQTSFRSDEYSDRL